MDHRTAKKKENSRAKKFLKNCIEPIPGVGPGIISAYRQLRLFNRVLQARLIKNEAAVPDPETVYWIDPKRIRLHTNFAPKKHHIAPEDRVFDLNADRAKVYDGDWDISGFEFRELEIYQALEDVIIRKRRWEHTSFYQTLVSGLGSGSNPFHIESQADLEARCEYLDRLIASVQSQGYKLAHEVSLTNEANSLEKHKRYGSEISVNIGRDGLYLFQDGRHRLAIAQILGIEKVPVKVLVRHKKWIELRSYLLSLAKSRSGASKHQVLYQIPCHPDLADIPAAHGCEDRLTAIRDHLNDDRGMALDIGANLGYFCHGLEDLGFNCIAIEILPQIAFAAERIRDAERKSFAVLSIDLFDATESEGFDKVQFEVVLALNIFHHFLKDSATYEKLKKWLNQLDVSQMFFEPHCSDEDQMVGAFRNYGEDEFVGFLLENSVLNQSKLIHRCDDGRSLYKLWK